MAFLVEITDSALADAEDYVRFIREEKREPDAAERWWQGLLDHIFSLEQMPERCPVIPEADELDIELRHLIYCSHRIIFRIKSSQESVLVLRVYHGARKRLRPEAIAGLAAG